MLNRADETLRTVSSEALHLLEGLLYASVGLLLAGAALAVLVDAVGTLWHDIAEHRLAGYGLEALDQLLLVLVLVEILHTVRISIRSKEIILEPFLIVGLIASVRRVLVIAMQAAHGPDTPGAFQKSMIELGVVGVLILMFVVSIYILRKSAAQGEMVKEYDH